MQFLFFLVRLYSSDKVQKWQIINTAAADGDTTFTQAWPFHNLVYSRSGYFSSEKTLLLSTR